MTPCFLSVMRVSVRAATRAGGIDRLLSLSFFARKLSPTSVRAFSCSICCVRALPSPPPSLRPLTPAPTNSTCVRACACARASRRGDCNKLCNFSAQAVAFRAESALRSPSVRLLPLLPPSTNTFFYFPPPSYSLPFFLAQRESLEKKRGFYSGSPPSSPLPPSTPLPSPGFLKPIHGLSVRFQSPISAL